MTREERNAYMREYLKDPVAKAKKRELDRKRRAYNPEASKNTKLKGAYKITIEQYNRGMGWLGDKIEILEATISYLRGR